MAAWQKAGQSDEWYTPKYIFDALGCTFDMDVASPPRQTHVPCRRRLSCGGLMGEWEGFVWMNPPFGGRNGIVPWLDLFFQHGNGIALAPDRTSAPWFQEAAPKADLILFLSPKVKFERPDGTVGKWPGDGSVLFGVGEQAEAALERAASLGLLVRPITSSSASGREMSGARTSRPRPRPRPGSGSLPRR